MKTASPYSVRHWVESAYAQADQLQLGYHHIKNVFWNAGLPACVTPDLLKEDLAIFYEGFNGFYKQMNCDVEQASHFFKSYFDNDFAHYAPLIIKKIYQQVQNRAIVDLFDGLSAEQSQDLSQFFALGGVSLKG